MELFLIQMWKQSIINKFQKLAQSKKTYLTEDSLRIIYHTGKDKCTGSRKEDWYKHSMRKEFGLRLLGI